MPIPQEIVTALTWMAITISIAVITLILALLFGKVIGKVVESLF